MGRARLAVAAVIMTMSMAACFGTAASLPPPTGSVAPSVGSVPQPTPVPGSETQGPAGGLTLTAINIEFQPTTLEAPAAGFHLRFENREPIPHGVVILDGNGNRVFESEIVTGPVVADLSIPALDPQAFTFMCPVHPNMTGTLIVTP